ncbi:hypothetical protein QYF36_024604 [Acer negundo]|nr:hypothetical protein QYF36_024604 [Acer negundo]
MGWDLHAISSTVMTVFHTMSFHKSEKAFRQFGFALVTSKYQYRLLPSHYMQMGPKMKVDLRKISPYDDFIHRLDIRAPLEGIRVAELEVEHKVKQVVKHEVEQLEECIMHDDDDRPFAEQEMENKVELEQHEECIRHGDGDMADATFQSPMDEKEETGRRQLVLWQSRSPLVIGNLANLGSLDPMLATPNNNNNNNNVDNSERTLEFQ